jgi:cytochrome c5
MLSRVWVVVVTVSAALTGCERGPSPDEQNTLGASVWETKCQFCHTEGGLGTRITPASLASRGSVGNLVDYVRLAMPYGLGGTLPDEEYRAVVAFLLHEHGLLPENMAVGPASADTFRLDH